MTPKGIQYIGIDPGVSGAISTIKVERGHDPEITSSFIYPCPADLVGMADLLTTLIINSGAEFTRITLEKVGSFGMEGRATLATFMINFGQWQGIIEGSAALIAGVDWRLATPQAWQKPYRERLIAGPEKPRREQFTSKPLFNIVMKVWKSANEQAKRARKKELMRIAEENGAPLKPLNMATADSYLIAIHGKDNMEWT